MNRLPFEQIDPYIRLSHLFQVSGADPLPLRSAYDCRIMYIAGGTGRIRIGNARHEAGRGNLFFWRPGIPYELLPDSGDGLAVYGINFDFTQAGRAVDYPIPPESVGRFDPDKMTEIVEFTDTDCFNDIIALSDMQSLEPHFQEIEAEYMMRKRFYMHRIRGQFLMLLGDIARHATQTFTEREHSVHKVDLILQYIREHYNEPLTNRDIADHFNFHPVYVNRLFVKYTGTSLHQYLLQYRLSQAVSLMLTSGKTVTEAALETGFTDINHFSKCFKRRFGLSPKHYLNNAGRSSQ